LKSGQKGDTTGCGDNFVGGVLLSMIMQLEDRKELLDLVEACSWGVVSGGAACFYMGGTYAESEKGEKLSLISPYLKAYNKQIVDLV
jgi:sugar/nucleoside kinase (ribokinase family)